MSWRLEGANESIAVAWPSPQTGRPMSDSRVDASAEALARRLLHALPGHHDVPRAAFERLPAPVARRLHRQLDARVDREAALPSTPWLDAEHPDARAAAASWRTAARAAARVPADAWEEMLANASRDALAHLVRPAPALADHAFRDEADPLPTPLVLDRIGTFEAYPYLPEIVERYVEKKGLGHIDRDGLARLLDRIDSRMVAGFGPDDWVRLFAPLFDLLEDAVPADLLRQAFEARGQAALADGLRGDVTAGDLHAHLASSLAEAEPAGPSAKADESDPDVTSPEAAPSGVAHPPEAPVTSPLPFTNATTDPPTTGSPKGMQWLDKAAAPDAADELATDQPATDEPATNELATPSAPEDEAAEPPPPIIGSKYNAPETTAPDDSDVLGSPRAVEVVAPMEPLAPPPRPESGITDAVVTETFDASDDAPLWKRLAGDAASDEVQPEAPSDAPTPLWARFSQDAASSSETAHASSTADAPRATSASTTAASSASLADRYTYDTRPSPRTALSLDALEEAVLGTSDPERRAWYTAELFSGDADAYRATLLRLDGARTWTEATDIIAGDIFRAHRVNIYSDPAVTFTDAVEEQMGAR